MIFLPAKVKNYAIRFPASDFAFSFYRVSFNFFPVMVDFGDLIDMAVLFDD
jgi:hypothetical protein